MASSARLVEVSLGPRSYPIEIGTGTLPSAGGFIHRRTSASHAVIVTDTNVEPHAARVAESLAAISIRVDLLVIEPGESAKSVDVASQLWQKLLELGTDRKSVVAAVGGGVIGDLAGFVAATYARGLSLVQIPTTLLAQVDSSVGGKVGVNLPAAKNMVGAFWQPRGVLIDTDVLATLPDREFRAGLAEVVKYGVILDADLFDYVEGSVRAILARDPAALQHIITRSCRLKADVVEQDEREETGLRAILNYGHTFAHALEAVTQYGQWLHGEAVAIGMVCAARLATSLGMLAAGVVERQSKLLSELGLPTELPNLNTDALLDAMQHDKKVEHGRLKFVLPSRIGHVEQVGDLSAEQVRAVLATR